MGALERLTYLLGICVAVITWSVSQLTSSITADQILAYHTSDTRLTDGTYQQTFTLENLSRAQRPTAISVDESEDQKGCITSFQYVPDQIGLVIQAAAPADGDARQGFSQIQVNQMSPGARAQFQTVYKANCTVTPRLDIVAGSNANLRLLRDGVETWVVRWQFAIYVMLITFFGAAFVFTYVASYIAAKKPANP